MNTTQFTRMISQTDARQYRVHSAVLNRVLWDLAQALDLINDTDTEHNLNETEANEIIKTACNIIRQVKTIINTPTNPTE